MLAFRIKEDFFNVLAKDAGDLKRQVESWFIFACLNRIDTLPGHTDALCKIGLRPLLFRSQNPKPGFHWYRQEERIRPILQNAIINAGTKSEAPERIPNRCRRPTASVRSKEATKAKLVASWLISF